MGSLSDSRTDVCKQYLLNCSSLHKYTTSICPGGTCDPCKALEELDVEISDLEARLAKCSQQRRELKTTINSHHDRLIHRFPFEITSQIFTYVVEADNKPIPKRVLVLGAVCKRWRDIVLDAPAFWANITIDFWKHASVECFEVTQGFVERSRPLPLFLKISAVESLSRFTNIPQEQQRAVEHVVSILKSLHSRWRGLDFDGTPSVGRVLLSKLDQDPELDSLCMNLEGKGLQVQPDPISIQAKLNPRSLCITGFFFSAYLPLQCERLIKLEASMLAANELLHIIRNAPNLHTLRITNITRMNHPEFPLPTAPIIHNSLTHVDAYRSTFIGILRFFTLPALQDLSHTFSSIKVEFEGFLDCIHRSQFRSLTHLKIANQVMEAEDPYMDGHWYSEIPSLTHLHIFILHIVYRPGQSSLNMAEGCISPLGSRQQPLIFPLLREFDIDAPLMSTRSWSHLCNMLRLVDSNTGSIRPLERVLVKTSSTYDHHRQMEMVISEEDCLGFLDAIQNSGVHLDFKTVRSRSGYTDYLEEHRQLYGIPKITVE